MCLTIDTIVVILTHLRRTFGYNKATKIVIRAKFNNEKAKENYNTLGLLETRRSTPLNLFPCMQLYVRDTFSQESWKF
mgnify:FL=1